MRATAPRVVAYWNCILEMASTLATSRQVRREVTGWVWTAGLWSGNTEIQRLLENTEQPEREAIHTLTHTHARQIIIHPMMPSVCRRCSLRSAWTSAPPCPDCPAQTSDTVEQTHPLSGIINRERLPELPLAASTGGTTLRHYTEKTAMERISQTQWEPSLFRPVSPSAHQAVSLKRPHGRHSFTPVQPSDSRLFFHRIIKKTRSDNLEVPTPLSLGSLWPAEWKTTVSTAAWTGQTQIWTSSYYQLKCIIVQNKNEILNSRVEFPTATNLFSLFFYSCIFVMKPRGTVSSKSFEFKKRLTNWWLF